MSDKEENVEFRNELLMANPQYFNINRIKEDNTEEKFIQEHKKFYKKRIFSLSKDIFKNEINTPNTSDIIATYKNFLFSAINYLQLIDEKDLVQEKLNNKDNNTNNMLHNLPIIEEDYIGKLDLEIINDSINNKIKTIDEYYDIKSKKEKEEIQLPKILNINLKDEKLKTKGIKKNKNKNKK
jgi:hypothetical protein